MRCVKLNSRIGRDRAAQLAWIRCGSGTQGPEIGTAKDLVLSGGLAALQDRRGEPNGGKPVWYGQAPAS